MPVRLEQMHDATIVGPLGGLALSGVRARAPTLSALALRWYRDLARLGIHVPFFLVHDLGLLYAAPKDQVEIVTDALEGSVSSRAPPGKRDAACLCRCPP